MSVVGEWPVRVYYEDTDHGGGVYYANYLKFFERGRTELLRALGFEQDQLLERDRILFVVRRVEADYRRPAVFNDALRVVTEVADLGRARVDFHQSIHRDGEAEPLCRGRIQVACVGADDFRPSPIPTAVRHALGFSDS